MQRPTELSKAIKKAKVFMKKFSQKGFSLLGVIVAVFIIATGIIAILTLMKYSLSGSISSKNKLTAAFLAQEGVEIVRYIRESQPDWFAWYESISNGEYRVQYNNDSLMANMNLPLNIDSNGFYQYETGPTTPFYRRLALTKLSGNEELKVETEIKWLENGQWKYLNVEDRLWNWR